MTPEGDPLFDCAGISGPQLADVVALISGTDITELDVTAGATRLSLRRPQGLSQSSPAPPASDTIGAPHEPTSLAIASPLVGIFRPAVATGDVVQSGQTIGAIEAVGMPTNVDAPQSGTVEDLLVADGSPVEYGQPLLVLRRG